MNSQSFGAPDTRSVGRGATLAIQCAIRQGVEPKGRGRYAKSRGPTCRRDQKHNALILSRVAFPADAAGRIGVTLSRYAYDNGSTNDKDFAYRFPAGTDFNDEIRTRNGDGSY
jgi:hypothetical protein